jgi:hypothetical protein
VFNPDGVPQARTYYIATSSEEEMESWVKAIREGGPALPDTFQQSGSMKQGYHVEYNKETGKYVVRIIVLHLLSY